MGYVVNNGQVSTFVPGWFGGPVIEPEIDLQPALH